MKQKATSIRMRFQINTVFKSLCFSVCVWMEGENEQKNLRFRMKTYTCRRGLTSACEFTRAGHEQIGRMVNEVKSAI